MSGNVTLATLIASAKDRADMENSTLVSAAMWKEYVNRSKDALYDLLIAAQTEEYYAITHTFNLQPDVATYALPDDFYKLVSIGVYVDDAFLPLRKFTYRERIVENQAYRSSWPEYRVSASAILIDPKPTTTDEVELIYIPFATNLVNDNDTLKGFNGWEEFIVLDVAIKALRKEESDTSALQRDLIEVKNRLEEMIHQRDFASPSRVTDVTKKRRVNIW